CGSWRLRTTRSRVPTAGPSSRSLRGTSWRGDFCVSKPMAHSPTAPSPMAPPPMAHQPIVTTSRDADAPYYEGEARAIAAAVGGRYVPRDDRSLESLFAEGYPVVVFGGTGMRIHTRSGEIGWHPGMGHARVRQLRKGARDPMVEAMDLRPGDAVLDATLGLGSDALVASYVTGEAG